MKTTTDYDMKLMPSQIRAVMEAEQMGTSSLFPDVFPDDVSITSAKSNKGYDNFDIDMDDVLDDDKKTKKG
ncbi:unnamed protein product [Heligmosomoides polygyrus]|uniref:Serine endopeptidase inhibitor n=1 Tax=Heligmosomoides polygyrus TaxID=6339 RepID=A0A183FF02_HELPZ|nr:unnamed protein product [Heligmosomoides polygyrus]